MTSLLFLTFCSLYMLQSVNGHALLLNPPARNAIWREGFPNPINYNDNELNCGGYENQWKVNKGKCGVCGDPYQGPLKHQPGYPGGFANGFIGRVYQQGAVMKVTTMVTANHLGHLTFKICPSNDPSKNVTQECLDQYPLRGVNGQTKFKITDYIGEQPGLVTLDLQLPTGMMCAHCVVQWTYTAGNNCCSAHSPQETFQNCADVAVL